MFFVAAISFRTLGALDLRGPEGRELHTLLAQPKRVALLAYLCVARPRGFHRFGRRRGRHRGHRQLEADLDDAALELSCHFESNSLEDLQHGEVRRQHLGDEAVDEYDGTTAVVRTRHVPAAEVEFLRWRAERWIKVKHLPAAFVHSPRFALRHSLAMLRHTFAGTRVRSMLGMEAQRAVFERYREERRRQRAYV